MNKVVPILSSYASNANFTSSNMLQQVSECGATQLHHNYGNSKDKLEFPICWMSRDGYVKALERVRARRTGGDRRRRSDATQQH